MGGHDKPETALHGTQQKFIDTEFAHSAHNYHPLPVVLAKGEGCFMWDSDNRKYFDFLSAYSAVNQGHCHPRIVKALHDQSSTLALTSRAFHNDKFGDFCKFATEFFGYDKILPMNSGVEAWETGCKLMRRWGYKVKGVQENQAKIIFAENNFCGRSIFAISCSSDPDCYNQFGPFAPGIVKVPYNDIPALEKAFASDPNIVGMLYEPIQGEAGIIVPDDGFYQKAQAICKKHKALFCVDEIQTGLARTGKLLAIDHWGVRPDMIILGKALSGGMYPVSAVLCDNEIMLQINPGEHGSTYGGNPVGCAVAMEALKVLKEENMIENAAKLGELFRSTCKKMPYKWIKEVRGKGLLNAIECDAAFSHKVTAWQICVAMAKKDRKSVV